MHPSGKTRRVTIGGLAVLVVMAAVFTAGEALNDPGGWPGVGLIAMWGVPLVALAALSWRKPELASRIAGGVVIGVVALDSWAAFGPSRSASFERGIGPVRAIITFALAGVLAVLAAKRPARAGGMLAVIGAVPLALGAIRPDSTSAPLSLLSIPLAAAGVLVLASTGRAPSDPIAARGRNAEASRPRARGRAA